MELIVVCAIQGVSISNIQRDQGRSWQSKNNCSYCTQQKGMIIWSIWLISYSFFILIFLIIIKKRLYIGKFLWVLLKWESGSVAGFWISNCWEVAPEELSWDLNISDVFGWFWISELLRMIFMGTCRDVVIPDIRAELVRIEIEMTSEGDIFLVISVFFIIAFW